MAIWRTLWPRKPRYVWLSVFAAVWRQIDARNLGLIAAGVAFFSLLSLFPVLTALVSLWGIFADPVALQQQLALSREMFPAEAYRIIDAQIRDLAQTETATLSWTGGLALLIALWSARAGVGALTRGLNAVYEEPNRGGLRHLLGVLLLTLVLMVIALLVLGVLVLVPVVISFLPLGPLAAAAINVVKWLTLAIMLMATLGLVYRLAPNRRAARVPWLSPGALWATGLWLLTSAGFTLYLEVFGSYTDPYGSLGAIIILLLWFFVSAFVVLLGAALNAELEKHTAEDSTVGQPRPIGQRGARVADTYQPSSP